MYRISSRLCSIAQCHYTKVNIAQLRNSLHLRRSLIKSPPSPILRWRLLPRGWITNCRGYKRIHDPIRSGLARRGALPPHCAGISASHISRKTIGAPASHIRFRRGDFTLFRGDNKAVGLSSFYGSGKVLKLLDAFLSQFKGPSNVRTNVNVLSRSSTGSKVLTRSTEGKKPYFL